jgi:hypothetical protein
LAAISFPSLISFYHRKSEESALYQFMHTLTYAHHEALIREIPIGLCQSKNRMTCTNEGRNETDIVKNKMSEWKGSYIVFLDLFGDGSLKNPTQLLAVREGLKLSGQLHYRSYPFYRAYILFSPKRWMDNDNGTFWYCRHKNDSPSWAILMTKSGKARVAYPDKNGQISLANGKILACS